MKRLLIITIGVLIASGLGALDNSRMAYWETELGPQMSNQNIKTIPSEIKALTNSRLTKPNDPALKTKLGILYHNASLAQSSKGITGNALKATDLLESVTKDPKAEEELKVIAKAYLGSATALKGNEDLNPAMKITLVKQGLGIMDEVISQYGNASYLPRFVRGNVCISLPDFFEKLNQAGEDFKAVEAYASAQKARVPDEVLCQSFYFLGNFYKKQKKMKDAVSYWQKALDLDKEKLGAGKQAAEALDIYGD